MRTKTVNVYNIHEVSDGLKAKIIEDFRNDPFLDDHVTKEGLNSLKAYCNHFGVTLEDWQIGSSSASYAKTDANNTHFRKLKLKSCDPEFMPTGFCIDWNFFNEFYEAFKRTGDALYAFGQGLDYGILAITRECESCYEEESIIAMIEANDYEFLENGEIG